MFLAQDYTDTELIIYNTDIKHPLALDDTFDTIGESKIKVINNNIDFETKQPYTNVGAIRRDAFSFASGDGYITWDDDDIFFPWNIRQCVDGIIRTNKSAWKPRKSFIKHRGHTPELYFNNLEASILVKTSAIHQYGFDLTKSGAEHLGWLDNLVKENDITVDEDSIPGYCFYWSDEPEIGGHKQSIMSEFVREDNFQRHKLYTTDYATRPITLHNIKDHTELFSPFLNLLDEFKINKTELYDEYIRPNIEKIT
jgi:hypothetical protein